VLFLSGPNAYLVLYRAEGVIAPSFMALAETSRMDLLLERLRPWLRTCWKDYAHAWTKTSTVSVSRRRYGGCNVGWRGKIPNRRVLSSLAGSFTYLIQQISRHPPICFLYPSLAPFRLELRGSSDFRGMRC
jgi:hypothetical protein